MFKGAKKKFPNITNTTFRYWMQKTLQNNFGVSLSMVPTLRNYFVIFAFVKKISPSSTLHAMKDLEKLWGWIDHGWFLRIPHIAVVEFQYLKKINISKKVLSWTGVRYKTIYQIDSYKVDILLHGWVNLGLESSLNIFRI